MIIVIDYNVGNVRSVCNAFNYVGCTVRLSRIESEIRKADGLVLPGVAAFGYAIGQLGSLSEIVKDYAASGRPVLGICVGHQLLFDKSFEQGEHKGLGLIKGDVVALPPGRVIPHMGWNKVSFSKDMKLFDGLGGERHFYFAHSFYAKITDNDARIAFTDYGFNLPASVQKANIFGTQFHPEKSGPVGLQVLKNFASLCEKGADAY
jgi:imidazole glycerol-phosphate synthase subunit HisH